MPFASHRLRWLAAITVLLAGACAGILLAVLDSSGAVAKSPPPDPGFTWAAGAKRAPDFSLVDQHGLLVSLARLRGRPVFVTFIDPLCRKLCPLEAKVLGSAREQFPPEQRPAILAVSVNRWGNARRTLLHDVVKWRLGPDWRWAVGSPAALQAVWRDYAIGVHDAKTVVDGITIHDISHTEATYLVDSRGYQRALFTWPFRAEDVARAVEHVTQG